jgi:methylated-DNA-[protein]-cysteine S-methyltransferase
MSTGDEHGLKYIGFPQGKGKVSPKETWRLDAECFADAEMQLCEYFQGKRKRFDLKLAPTGTPFQLAVLQALQTIPAGETRSYIEIARQIGRPAAIRAVGAANGRNPLPIVIPCHRVIGSDGSLTGTGRCKTEPDNSKGPVLESAMRQNGFEPPVETR